jgi:dipeptidyl aminopeptidase/acylaminoacyl peptidase
MRLHRIFVAATSSLVMLSNYSNAQDRSFTVRDSIEMSIFIDPETRVGNGKDATVNWSPDGRHFAVVTARGVIESNETESTIWVFDSDEVRDVLLSQTVRKTVSPMAVARLAAVTNNRSVISDVRWSSDSKSIFFLGQGSTQASRLYQASVTENSTAPLTPPDVHVSQYESTDKTVVYSATIPDEDLENALKGHAINPGARAVTGMSLDAILFPNLWLKTDFGKSHDLWSIRSGENARVIDPSSGKPVNLITIDDGYGKILSLSPDGRSVIALRPINHWNPEWDSYEPDTPQHKFRTGALATRYFTYWAELPAEYTFIDLGSGTSTSLVNAPIARFQGYGQSTKAIWSSDGKEVLLGATYLSLHDIGAEEHSHRLRPCAAAVVEVGSGKVTCVTTMSRTVDPGAVFVDDFSFGESDQEVIVHRVNIKRKEEPTERYQRKSGVWTAETSSTNYEVGGAGSAKSIGEHAKRGALSVVVHQGLNEPPALFATNSSNGQSKKIWDPNPQFSTIKLGEVSVERWKDAGGHEWVAGLIKPPDYVPGKKYPLVIQTHGFAENRFLTDGGYTTALAARPLASAGIVVFQMPYNPEHFVSPEEVPDQILGFESAIDLLASKELIDPIRVGIIGFSRTCYHVEAALIKDPTRFAAATLADGVDESYVSYLLWSPGRAQEPEQEAVYGVKPFGEGLQAWMKSAPGFGLGEVKTPLRIEAISGGLAAILGEWEIYASLSLQNKPVDLIFFPDGEHELQKPLQRLASQQGNVDWFRFWLQSYEDPDPAKTEQYARWHELRKQ